ncbi:MAG: nuclear transport factor 2 family protein [Candidatus Cybelea sp.]
MKLAIGERNSKAIAALLAPDFISIDSSGQSETASAMIQEVDALPKDPLKVSTTTLLSVKVAGNSAVVDQRYDMKTVKTAADGSKADIQLVTLSTDSWVNIDGVWLLRRSVTNQLDYYKNGQLLMHKVRPQP